MELITLKGRDNEIELCFSHSVCIEEAEGELQRMAQENSEFFKPSSVRISYSGTELDYFDEVRFEAVIHSLFGKKSTLCRKKSLSEAEIYHSLAENEKICSIVRKSLRSGECVQSRGDIIIYGDVNPGATVSAKGNITVIGALRGVARTAKHSRVFAVCMQPTQIIIGNLFSYSKSGESAGAAVAIAEKGRIVLHCL